jgi:hypothetical protein
MDGVCCWDEEYFILVTKFLWKCPLGMGWKSDVNIGVKKVRF